ncbi:hypothetical protein ACFL1A_01710 [Patescibacteria group bacterium]
MKASKKKDQKNNKPIIPLLSFFLLALIISVTATLTKAQTPGQEQSLEVSPPSQELTTKPGETLIVSSNIRNRADKNLPIMVRIEDFVAQGDEGQVALVEKGPWAVSTWTSLSPTEFNLKPGEAKTVTATVQIPQTGAAGGKYGSFVFSVKGAESDSAAALSQEIASLFLIDIAGPKEENLVITTFNIPEFLEFGPVPIEITYNNSGNVHLHPHGVVAITDMFGNKVADVTQVGTNVFPQAERKVSFVWDKKFMIGRYSAMAIINSGGMKNTGLTATTSFVVFPIRIVLIIVVALIILWLMRKRLAKAMKALAGK